MTIEVRLAANLQKLVGGKKSVEAQGSTVGEVLDDLESRHPGLKDTVMADGEIHRFVNIYLNDEDIRFLQKLDTQLSDGDVISVLPALAGGAHPA
jgi:molybdopterin synthase sulfur carrier subunit